MLHTVVLDRGAGKKGSHTLGFRVAIAAEISSRQLQAHRRYDHWSRRRARKRHYRQQPHHKT